jgi:hypothetical protein
MILNHINVDQTWGRIHVSQDHGAPRVLDFFGITRTQATRKGVLFWLGCLLETK